MDRELREWRLARVFDDLCCELDRAGEEAGPRGMTKYADAIEAIYAVAATVLPENLREALELGLIEYEEPSSVRGLGY